MAKPRKPGTTRTARAKTGAKLKSESIASSDIQDAEVVGETRPDETVPDTPVEPAAKADDTVTTPEPAVEAPGAEVAEAPVATSEEVSEPAPAGPEMTRDDGASAESPEHQGTLPLSMPPAAVPPQKRSGFGGMVLGGVIAAGLGAGALFYGNQQGWVALNGTKAPDLQPALDAQTAEIGTLRAALDTAQSEIATANAEIVALQGAKPDLSGVTGSIDKVAGDLAALSGRLDATDTRLSGVEKQPIPKAELPAEVVAAYEAKFGELQSALEQRIAAMQTEQEQRIAAMQAGQDAKMAAIKAQLDQRLAEIETAQGVAQQAELSVIQATEAAKSRAALAEIDVALDTGTGFAASLETLKSAGVAAPEALTTLAEGGAPTLPELQASFPDAARASLVAATQAAAKDGSVDRMTAFFRTQLGARSLEPRDGSDPDAVLSRAESAVGRGELEVALSDIASLPDVGQAALTDWTTRARTRIEAKAALGTLAAKLNSN